MKKKIISKCCQAPIQHLPAGIMSQESVFLCVKCNKICEVKFQKEEIEKVS